jgi:hypothetical protein
VNLIQLLIFHLALCLEEVILYYLLPLLFIKPLLTLYNQTLNVRLALVVPVPLLYLLQQHPQQHCPFKWVISTLPPIILVRQLAHLCTSRQTPVALLATSIPLLLRY